MCTQYRQPHVHVHDTNARDGVVCASQTCISCSSVTNRGRRHQEFKGTTDLRFADSLSLAMGGGGNESGGRGGGGSVGGGGPFLGGRLLN